MLAFSKCVQWLSSYFHKFSLLQCPMNLVQLLLFGHGRSSVWHLIAFISIKMIFRLSSEWRQETVKEFLITELDLGNVVGMRIILHAVPSTSVGSQFEPWYQFHVNPQYFFSPGQVMMASNLESPRASQGQWHIYFWGNPCFGRPTAWPYRSSNKVWRVSKKEILIVSPGKHIQGSPHGPWVVLAVAESHPWTSFPQHLCDMLSLFQQRWNIFHTLLAHKMAPTFKPKIYSHLEFTAECKDGQQILKPTPPRCVPSNSISHPGASSMEQRMHWPVLSTGSWAGSLISALTPGREEFMLWKTDYLLRLSLGSVEDKDKETLILFISKGGQ